MSSSRFPEQITSYAQWMEGVLGPPNNPLPNSLANPYGRSPHQLISEFWTSWEGNNVVFIKTFIRSLQQHDRMIRTLLPMRNLMDVRQANKVRIDDKQFQFDEWKYANRVLGDQAQRAPSRRSAGEMTTRTRGFQGGGDGFSLPMDWMASVEGETMFQNSITTINTNVYLTLMYRVLSTIMRESSEVYNEDMESNLPLTHPEFNTHITRMVSNTFAINKNGSGFVGIETEVVSKGKTAGIKFDTVLVPSECVRVMSVERFPTPQDGPKRLPTPDETSSYQSRTRVHNLHVYESQRFSLNNGQGDHDPLSRVTTVSQRFVMVPDQVDTNFEKYKSLHRDVEIPNGEHRCWDRITLRRALDHCGIFAKNGHTGRWTVTDMGANILTTLCSSPGQDHGRGPGGGGGGAAESDHQPNVFGFGEETPRRHAQMPACATAMNLFKTGGLADAIIRFLIGMSKTTPEKFCDFMESLQRDETGGDPGMSTITDSRTHGDVPDSGRSRYNTKGFEKATGRGNTSSGDNSRLGRRQGAQWGRGASGTQSGDPEQRSRTGGNRGQNSRNGTRQGGRTSRDAASSTASRRTPGEEGKVETAELCGSIKRIAMFLLDKVHAHAAGEGAISLSRTVSACFNDDDIVFPILCAAEDASYSITMPYSGPTTPASYSMIAVDPYWKELDRRFQNCRSNQLVQSWVEAATTFLQAGANPQLYQMKDHDERSARLIRQTPAHPPGPFALTLSFIGAGTLGSFESDVEPRMMTAARQDLMSISNTLVAHAINPKLCTAESECMIRAFLTHLVHESDPEDKTDRFVKTMEVMRDPGNNEPGEMVETIEVFMRTEGRRLLRESERRNLSEWLGEGGIVERASKRHAGKAQTRDDIISLLSKTELSYTFFDTLIQHNIPFPMAFILFRMNIRIQASSMVFMVSGEATGIVVVDEGHMTFTKRDSDFAIDVNVFFKTAVLVTQQRNLHIVPNVMSEKYISGAGTIMWNHSAGDVERYKNDSFVKDIFVMAVPYNWKQTAVWTDITGKMNPRIYNSQDSAHGDHEHQFRTAHIYKRFWGFKHDPRPSSHIFAIGNNTFHNPTLSLQSSQRVHNGNYHTTDLSKQIVGHCPMGRSCVPTDFQVMSTGSMAAAGTGLESYTPRRDRM
jgi:hypothetical protein